MLVDRFYQLMNKGLLRALILIMALGLALCILWEPTIFASNTSSLMVWQGILLIWAICSGVIFGVGFNPEHFVWRLLFHPLPAFLILIFGLYHFFK
ncbi:cyd operon protein YbgE [Xenorhabdus innexi]|uniref:Cyd operon protein YbgE n=1 Tax=Xenorhabdus innexi TaxID=290109 RepID=A0A2G0NMW5_9GAMM|nr:cyd operon protein YbgE [Xenorhabdus innexi]PHM36048.1 cyd operon protein YbgE [Xenorhabdus innexi]